MLRKIIILSPELRKFPARPIAGIGTTTTTAEQYNTAVPFNKIPLEPFRNILFRNALKLFNFNIFFHFNFLLSQNLQSIMFLKF